MHSSSHNSNDRDIIEPSWKEFTLTDRPIELKTAQTMKIEPQSPVLRSQTSDGAIRLEVRLKNETVCLSQTQMAELFQTSIPNVSMHICVFAEGELQAPECKRRQLLRNS